MFTATVRNFHPCERTCTRIHRIQCRIHAGYMQDTVQDTCRLRAAYSAGYMQEQCRIHAGYVQDTVQDTCRIHAGYSAGYMQDTVQVTCRIHAGYMQDTVQDTCRIQCRIYMQDTW